MEGRAIAWHGETSLHESAKLRMRQHVDADQVLQGDYWHEYGDGRQRGCWLGCMATDRTRLAAGNMNMRYEVQSLFGIAASFTHALELVFEHADAVVAPLVAEYETAVIPPGLDTSDGYRLFCAQYEEPALGVGIESAVFGLLAVLQRLCAEQDIPFEYDPVVLMPHRFPQEAQRENVMDDQHATDCVLVSLHEEHI